LKKSSRTSFIFSIILFISLAILSFVSAGGSQPLLYAKLIWALIVSYFGLCIYRDRSISKYRSILFILIAFFFFLEFKFFRFLQFEKTIPPYCHIAQTPTLFNFIHSQFLSITGGEWKVWGILTLGFLWLLKMFTIGQGICSWDCFYGGIAEACTKVLRKPLIKLKIPKAWRDFPLAFLIFLLIISFLQGLPVFCNWFCPFKMTTAFWDSQSIIRIAQMVFFFLFLGVFVVALPVLSKKRFFCSMICPFGALVSVCGKVSPYKVTIEQEKCTRCGKCFEVCPTFAVKKQKKDDPASLQNFRLEASQGPSAETRGKSHSAKADEYKISSYCNKCGACIDVCPAKAISISVSKYTTNIPFSSHTKWRIEIRDIFIFLSLLITGVLSGTFVPRVILRLLGVS